ncbi:MAG: hypothetical protein ACJ77Z_16095 [Thermoleophilaceae bacterium]
MAGTRPGAGATRSGAAATARQQRPRSAAQSDSGKSNNVLGTIAKGAIGALAGTAAIGLAGRAAVKRARQPRVLGVRVPRGLQPNSLDPRHLDMKKVAKQVAKVAERVERTSEGVRIASGQAKNVSRKLS